MEENENKTFIWLKNELSKEKPIIEVDSEIVNYKAHIRGVYGFFVNDACIYVGKAESIYYRMFRAGGHIASLRVNLIEQNLIKEEFQEKKLQCALLKAINNGEQISIEILDEVKLLGDNYYKDMQRLASSENKHIDEYQSKDQCLNQVPAGKQLDKKIWEKKK